MNPESRKSPAHNDESHYERDARWLRRLGHIGMAFVIAAALIGFFVGLDDGVAPFRHPEPEKSAYTAPDAAMIPPAASYSEMPSTDLGPNADWITRLPEPEEDLTQFYGVLPAAAAERQAAVGLRMQQRAYRGAPPVVPHSIDQRSATSCLVCHGEGLRVGDVIAPRMSHETYLNCTQCHVESSNAGLPPAPPERVVANAFDGLAASGAGERAWPGAPPTIPHSTWMRENCLSCHGPLAKQGLRSSHPWRVNCEQCHAPSAELDQFHALHTQRPPLARAPEVVGE